MGLFSGITSALSDVVGGVTGAVGDVVGGVGNVVGDLGSSIDDTVRGVVPGGWASLAAMAAGVPPGQAMQMGGVANNLLGGGGGSGLVSGLTSGGGGGGYYGGGSPIVINTGGQQQPSLFAKMLPFLAQTGGGLAQQQVNKEAAQAQADALRAAGLQAQQASQFRPVGTTTRFGSSNFQVDPTTGQLISAGYTPSALAQGYQDALAGMTTQGLTQGQAQQALASQYLASQQGQPVQALGQQYMASQLGSPLTAAGLSGLRSNIGQPLTAAGLQDLRSNVGQPLTSLGQQYLGESPEAIRQRYVQQQTALLAPQQEQALAGIRNNLFQTGRTGLATGATSAGGLAATNPEMAAYYNSLANQQRQIAAGADQAAQQQAQFGSQLYGTGQGLTQQARQQAAGQLATGLGLTQQGQQQGASQYSTGVGLTQAGQLAGAGLFGTGLGLTQQGQQFGQQLGTAAFSPFTAGFGAQSAIESAAQQPMKMSTDLASQFQQANQTGAYYNLNAQNAAANAMLRANQVSPFADILTALGKTPEATTALGSAVGGLFGGLLGGGTPSAQATTNPYGFDASALNFGGWSDLGGGSGGTGYDWSGLGSVDQWWL